MMLFKVFYTNWFIPAGFSAIVLGPFIFIRPSRKDDVGLLEHEKVHVEQFYRSWGLFWIFYLLSKKFRYAWELEAYRKQLQYDPQKVHSFAVTLATRYRLGLSVEQVEADLKAR